MLLTTPTCDGHVTDVSVAGRAPGVQVSATVCSDSIWSLSGSQGVGLSTQNALLGNRAPGPHQFSDSPPRAQAAAPGPRALDWTPRGRPCRDEQAPVHVLLTCGRKCLRSHGECTAIFEDLEWYFCTSFASESFFEKNPAQTCEQMSGGKSGRFP